MLTQAAEAAGEWERLRPKRCGAGERTHLVTCTPRDQCGKHRDHHGLWLDALDRFVDYLHDDVPVRAAETPEATPRPRRRPR